MKKYNIAGGMSDTQCLPSAMKNIFVCMNVKLYLTTLASVNYIAGFHKGHHTNTKCYIK